MGEDDVRCWYHLRKTLYALLRGSNTEGGVSRALFTLWTITVTRSRFLRAASTLPSPSPAGEVAARAEGGTLGRFPSVHHRWCWNPTLTEKRRRDESKHQRMRHLSEVDAYFVIHWIFRSLRASANSSFTSLSLSPSLSLSFPPFFVLFGGGIKW